MTTTVTTRTRLATAVLAATLTWGAASAQQAPVTVTFDERDYDGWTILGFQDAVWRPEGGNPGAHLNFSLDNFYIRIYNAASPNFVGDFGEKGPVAISGDLRWRTIRFGSVDVSRDLFFAIWDEYVDADGAPRVHVVYRPLGKIRGQGANAPWRTSRVRVPNPNSPNLPGGWLYWPFDGAIEPTRSLPDGVTWSGILASADRVQWTTATPGLLFGFTVFDVSFDNARIEPLRGPSRDGATVDRAISLTEQLGLDVASGPSAPEADPASLPFDPDGVVDAHDLDRFRRWHAAGLLLADVTTTGAVDPDLPLYGVSDGWVDPHDLEVFESAWAQVTSSP